MKRLILFSILVLVALPAPLFALPAISCHCFQDRSFDPARPAAADSYFLATAQNRLMADEFSRPKREIVMSKQAGTSGDDLWIAYRAAEVSGRDHETLLRASKEQGSWGEVLKREGVQLSAQEMNSTELARQIVATILANRGLTDPAVVKDLYADGAGTQEAILAVILSNVLNRPAEQVWQQVSTGEHSWGEILDSAGMTADLDVFFARLMSAKTN